MVLVFTPVWLRRFEETAGEHHIFPQGRFSSRGRKRPASWKQTGTGQSPKGKLGFSVSHNLCIITSVIRRLYVHNFRCLENFELPISGRSSVLLIGKNGAGKTTVSFALEILQKIARGTNRVGDLVKIKDLARGRTDVPLRFEIEVDVGARTYGYTIAFEFPEGFKELRVFEEKLTLDGKPVYTREAAQVHLSKAGQEKEANFFIDWHLVALPIVQLKSSDNTLSVSKSGLLVCSSLDRCRV
jgi:ABC-type branched-subunit amino acid transport system ATPase component